MLWIKTKEFMKNFRKCLILGIFLVITIGFAIFIGLEISKNHKDNVNDFFIILFMIIPFIFILLKFKFYKLYYFDFFVNLLVFISYLVSFKIFKLVLLIYLVYRIFVNILLFIVPNDKFKSWCEEFTEKKIYLIGIIIHIILIIYIDYNIEATLYFFLVSIILIFLIPIICRLLCISQRLQYFDFIQNSIFLIAWFLILLCLNDKSKIFYIFKGLYYIKLCFLLLFFIYLLYYSDSNVKKRMLYNKNQKVNDWFMSLDYANLLNIEKFKNINLRFNIMGILAKENRNKSKFLERKILLRFKDKTAIEREKFILNRTSDFVYFGLLIPLLISIPPLMFDDVLYGDKLTLNFIKNVFKSLKTKTLKNLVEKFFNTSVDIMYLFFFSIMILLLFFLMTKFYINRKRYLALLNYVSNNYQVLFKEHNIKKIFIPLNINKEMGDIIKKKYLNNAIINFEGISNLNNFELQKLKKFLKFFEDNGIDIYIYSINNKESRIKEYLKDNGFDDFEFIIIDKKEILNNLNSKDKEFMAEFCKKLYISSNECFILVDSDDKNIYYEIDSLENNKIIKQKEPFYDITKMLEFLQSKME